MRRLAALTAVAALAACTDTATTPDTASVAPTFSAVEAPVGAPGYALFSAEYITADGAQEMGRTVYFEDRGNKRTGAHFVEGDPRRDWNGGAGITFAVDGVQGPTSSGLSQADTDGAIRSAMATWEGVRCSNLPLIDLGNAPFDYGYVQYLFGFGGFPGIAVDLAHAGFLPGPFFDLLAPGGSSFILGVTFTLVFVDENGDPTDVDNDGQSDAAFREIYYNDAFGWNTGSTYDVETVALHEAGHGLSQAHFGSAFATPNGKIHFSPRAVMNASYSGVQTGIRGTDNSGHCTNWGNWGSATKK